MKKQNLNIKIKIIKRKNKTKEQRSLYKCVVCGSTSIRKYNVLRHIDRFHRPLMVPLLCCNERFWTKWEKKQHLQSEKKVHLRSEKKVDLRSEKKVHYDPKKRVNSKLSTERLKKISAEIEKKILEEKRRRATEQIPKVIVIINLSKEELKDCNDGMLRFLDNFDFDTMPRAK